MKYVAEPLEAMQVSVDISFWKSGSGSASELYEDATDGEPRRFAGSEDVVNFRADLLNRWPDLRDSVEPLEYNPDLEEQEDLSRFIVITMPASKADRLEDIVDLARSHDLKGFDPQIDAAIE